MKMNWKLLPRVLIAVLLFGVMAFGLTGSAMAADFRAGNIVIIEEDEVIDDDLFVTGNRVEVHGTVKGDLIATGTEVLVDGKVEGSLAISGYSLVVDGTVEGSLYGAGFGLAIEREGRIGRNVYFAGFSLITDAGSTIGRSTYVTGYQAVLDGDVADDISASVGALVVNGTVGGDVTGTVTEGEGAPDIDFVPGIPGIAAFEVPGFRVGDDAEIAGDVRVEVVQIEQPEAPTLPSPGNIVAGLLGRAVVKRVGEFLALLIVGALLLLAWPKLFRRVGNNVQAQPLPSAGWGCVTLVVFVIGVPVVAGLIILLAIIGGALTFGELLGDILGIGFAALALIIAVFSFTVTLVTKAVVSQRGGDLILGRLSEDRTVGFWPAFGALALGAFLYEILRAIPFVGWIVAAIVILVGLGAIFLVAREEVAPPAPKEKPEEEPSE
ncbi:MAG: hypothetical protein GTO18_14495 [Anaerolineales bacterium]|nr:hypothetical protein [Anaerolineales bacterium]